MWGPTTLGWIDIIRVRTTVRPQRQGEDSLRPQGPHGGGCGHQAHHGGEDHPWQRPQRNPVAGAGGRPVRFSCLLLLEIVLAFKYFTPIDGFKMLLQIDYKVINIISLFIVLYIFSIIIGIVSDGIYHFIFKKKEGWDCYEIYNVISSIEKLQMHAAEAGFIINGAVEVIKNSIAALKGNINLEQVAKNSLIGAGKSGVRSALTGGFGSFFRNAGHAIGLDTWQNQTSQLVWQ